MFPNTLPSDIECQVGGQVDLIENGKHGLRHFPDGPICILENQPLQFLMVCGNETILLAGANFQNAAQLGTILGPSHNGPDAHYAGVYATWPGNPPSRRLAAYHAENKEGMGKIVGNSINGFYASVCLASIDDMAGEAERLGRIITADTPKMPVEGPVTTCQGVGEPHVIADGGRKFLLAYYTEWSNRQHRNVTICLARSPIESGGMPESWKKYRNGRFEEEGLGGHETPVLSCSLGDVFQAHATYVMEWNRYIMLFCCLLFDEYQSGQPQRSGFYASTSVDGIQWTEPQKLITMLTVFKDGHSSISHPTLIVRGVKGDQLDGELYYAFTPRWPEPHHLVSRSVSVRIPASSFHAKIKVF